MRMKFIVKVAVVILLFGIGTTHAKDVPFPEAFKGLSPGESVYACTVYFHDAVGFEMSALKLQPNNVSYQKALRTLVRMKTNLLAMGKDIPDERKDAAEGMLGLKVEHEPPEILRYCAAVSNAAEEKMGAKLKGWVDELIEEELKKLLRSIGARNWRQPPR
jgi:hypothetical protein